MVCTMSRNGSVIAIRCSPDREEPEVLAENNEDDCFDGPIGVLVLDQTGQALKFVIDQGQVTPEATTRLCPTSLSGARHATSRRQGPKCE